MELQRYFPYRLAVLAEQVSMAVADVYAKRFHLTRAEWRILAALGDGSETAATDIGRITTLDKMQVSRAMQRLERRGIVRRAEARSDRRKRMVRLTDDGRALYAEIVPLALAREAAILATLSIEERRMLDRMMDRVCDTAARSISGVDDGAS